MLAPYFSLQQYYRQYFAFTKINLKTNAQQWNILNLKKIENQRKLTSPRMRARLIFKRLVELVNQLTQKYLIHESNGMSRMVQPMSS